VILTTTDTIPGRDVEEILGIVAGSSIMGTTYIRDAISKISDIFGGRAGGYEKDLEKTTSEAVRKLVEQAKEVQADAVIGLKTNIEVVPTKNFGLFVVQCIGTAVKLKGGK